LEKRVFFLEKSKEILNNPYKWSIDQSLAISNAR